MTLVEVEVEAEAVRRERRLGTLRLLPGLGRSLPLLSPPLAHALGGGFPLGGREPAALSVRRWSNGQWISRLPAPALRRSLQRFYRSAESVSLRDQQVEDLMCHHS